MSAGISDAIKFIQDAKTTGTIIFGRKKPKDSKNDSKKPAQKFPRLSFSEVSPDTTDYFKKGYSSFLTKRESWKAETDKVSDIDKGSYQVLDEKEIQDQELLGDPDSSAEIKKIEPSFTRGLRFIEFRFKRGKENLRVFTHYTPGMFFQAKSKNKVAVIFSGSQLTPVEKDLLLLPSKYIDCLLFKGKMLIFQETNFDLIFEMKEKYTPNSKAVFKYFRSEEAKTELGFSILGLSDLETKCVHLRELKKMNSIFLGEKFKKLKYADILALDKAYDLEVIIDRKNKTIDFQGNVEAFVRLFDLRHLKHPRTGDKVLGLRVKHLR